LEPEQLQAIVVGRRDFGEAHRVVRLLTESGVRHGVALGAKQSRRRFLGVLEPFASIEVVLEPDRRRMDGHSLFRLTSGVVVRPRLQLRRSLEVLSTAGYLTQLAASVAMEAQPSESLFRHLGDALDFLAKAPASRAVRCAFELWLLADLGYLSAESDHCVRCKKPIVDRAFFNVFLGGMLCAEHGREGKEIGPKTRLWFRGVLADLESGFCPEAGLAPDWADRAAKAVEAPLDRFLSDLVGRSAAHRPWVSAPNEVAPGPMALLAPLRE
jgi:DNA repair protein RecO